jgi:hypothetical protein
LILLKGYIACIEIPIQKVVIITKPCSFKQGISGYKLPDLLEPPQGRYFEFQNHSIDSISGKKFYTEFTTGAEAKSYCIHSQMV